MGSIVSVLICSLCWPLFIFSTGLFTIAGCPSVIAYLWWLFPLFASALSTYYHSFSYSLWFMALRVFWAVMYDKAISAELISCFPCMHIMHLLLETFETAGSSLCISLFLLDTVSVQRKEGSRKLNLNYLGFRKPNNIPKMAAEFPSPLVPPT